MRNYLIIFFVFFSFFSPVYCISYISDKYQMNLEILDGWRFLEEKPQKSISMIDDTATTTINVTAFYFEEPVSANGLQQWRLPGRYDGWMHLFEREGSEDEIYLSGAEDMRVVVYSKHLLDESMEVTEIIAGEYCYVKGNNGYVVTVLTPKDAWSSIQPSLRKVLDSFWIGKGDRPTLKKKGVQNNQWAYPGASPGNSFYSHATPLFNSIMQQKWQLTLPLSSDEKENLAPIIVENRLIFYFQSYVYCYDITTSELLWNYPIKHLTQQTVSEHRGIVYFSEEEGSISGVILESGQRLFKTGEADYLSAPFPINDALISTTENGLAILKGDTGERQFFIPEEIFPNMLPVSDHQNLAVVSKKNTIQWIHLESKKKVWESKEISGDIVQLMLGETAMFLLISQPQSDAIVALTKETGELLWKFQTNDGFKHSNHMSLSKDKLLLPMTEISEDIVSQFILALDVNSGEIIWKYAYDTSPNARTSRPIIVDGMCVVWREGTGILAHDSMTGEPLSVRTVSEEIGDRDLLAIRFFEESMITFDHSNNGLNITLLK
jgi:hypothetical protein